MIQLLLEKIPEGRQNMKLNSFIINYWPVPVGQDDGYCSDDALDFYLMAGSMPEIPDQYTTITKSNNKT